MYKGLLLGGLCLAVRLFWRERQKTDSYSNHCCGDLQAYGVLFIKVDDRNL